MKIVPGLAPDAQGIALYVTEEEGADEWGPPVTGRSVEVCSSREGTFAVNCKCYMNKKNRLDSAAEQLLDIFEQHAQDLPAQKRDAKWHAFNRVVATIDSSAKSQVKSKTLVSPRAAQRHAEP